MIPNSCFHRDVVGWGAVIIKIGQSSQTRPILEMTSNAGFIDKTFQQLIFRFEFPLIGMDEALDPLPMK